jgi:alkylated DNA nucleotide flippase Atl1
MRRAARICTRTVPFSPVGDPAAARPYTATAMDDVEPRPQRYHLEEAVLGLVARIPPGRVMSYGQIARCLQAGSPRRVGTILARYGSAVAWHRVVTADGRVPAAHRQAALRRLAAEGTPVRHGRVAMSQAAWTPPDVDP